MCSSEPVSILLIVLACTVVPVVVHLLIRKRGLAVWLSITLSAVAYQILDLLLNDGVRPWGYPGFFLLAALVAVFTSLVFGQLTHDALHGKRHPNDGLPRCEHCGYVLVGLPDRRCPECGSPF